MGLGLQGEDELLLLLAGCHHTIKFSNFEATEHLSGYGSWRHAEDLEVAPAQGWADVAKVLEIFQSALASKSLSRNGESPKGG